MSAPLALKASGLVLRYGGHRALDEVYLDIPRGQVLAVIGPSGCGKTSLLRCLTWLAQPQEGFIEIDGQPFGRERAAGGAIRRHSSREIDRMRPRIGLVFQALNLWPHLSVSENVMRAQRTVLGRGAEEARDKAEQMLERLRIGELAEKMPAQLSGGQRQRVAIARALAMDPALMLFDEPTSALDAELVGEVLTLLRELAASGMTMLVVTHEMGFARHIADRMIFMDAGRIVADDRPEAVMNDSDNPRVRDFFSRLTAFHGAPAASSERAEP